MKTNFGPGVIVTSKWLNGARELHFDGKDLDWHYAPINRRDIQRGGSDGIDNVYVTVSTDQVFGGVPVTGTKSFMGLVAFGDKSASNGLAAPKSWATNAKFNAGGSQQNFTIRYAQLKDEDIITKQVLSQTVENFPAVDEGFF
jgi:hypothetical protein